MSQLTYSQVDRDIIGVMQAPGWRYYAILVVDLIVLAWGIFAWRYTVVHGLGVWGLTHPVMWAR